MDQPRWTTTRKLTKARKQIRNKLKLGQLSYTASSQTRDYFKAVHNTDTCSHLHLKKVSLKKQFKSLIRSINNNLTHIGLAKKKSIQPMNDPSKIPSSQTYVNFTSNCTKDNAATKTQGPLPTYTTSGNLINSPTFYQQQQKQMPPVGQQHQTLSRTNSSTNANYYQTMSNTSMNSYTAPSTPQQPQSKYKFD